MTVRDLKTSELLLCLIRPGVLIDALEHSGEVLPEPPVPRSLSAEQRAQNERAIEQAILEVVDEIDRRLPIPK